MASDGTLRVLLLEPGPATWQGWLICVSVRPNHCGFTAWLCRQGQVSRRCVDKGATAGAGSDDELGPQAVSRKAESGSFHGLSRRSGPEAWPLPTHPSYRRRRQARRSQGGNARDCA